MMADLQENFHATSDEDALSDRSARPPAEAFCAAILEKLGYAPKAIIGDGKFHRFSTSKSRRDDAGWYRFHDDDFPAGTFGDWRTDTKINWHARETSQMSAAERQRLDEVKVEREKKIEAERMEAVAAAKEHWTNAAPSGTTHPYLRVKNIGPHGIREAQGRLLVPVYLDGEFVSLQTIDASGEKLFAKGARVEGGSYTIGEPGKTIIIGEGFATCATLREATGLSAVVAFNAGNLLPVAKRMREKYPAANIIIAADDDFKTEGERGFNPGVRAAKKAAVAVGALVAAPPFDRAKDGDVPSDWNDYAALRGKDAANEAFQAAQDAAASGSQSEASSGDDTQCAGKSDSQSTASANWPEPKPLHADLPPVPAFDPLFLPDALRPWVADISERMQCALDFVAVSVVVALGSIIGRKVAIRPQRFTDWFEVANLWACIVGRPGVMKSPAMNEALKPLNKLEAKANKENEEALTEFRRATRVHELKVKASERAASKLKADDITDDVLAGDAPEPPRMRRYIVGDTTYEKLGETLAHNPDGVLAFRDEIVSLLKSLDDERNAAARGFYLQAWMGTSGYTFDRVVRGLVRIEAACLSLLGSTQPGRLGEYVRRSQGAGDDGMLQRFSLLVWPDQTPEWRLVDRYPDSGARKMAWETFDRLDQMTPHSVGAELDDFGGIPFLRFDDAAQRQFDEWRDGLEKRLRASELSPALESHLAKFRKLVPALALISHLADGGRGPVAETALLRALAIAEYAEAHARRCYSAADQGEVSAAKAILAHIRKGDLTDGFALRDVHQSKWSKLTDREQVQQGLDLLVELDWLREKKVHTIGRPSVKYVINPRVRE